MKVQEYEIINGKKFKKCPDNKIRNLKTNRCVLITGKIGNEIIKKNSRKIQSITGKTRNEIIKKNSREIPSIIQKTRNEIINDNKNPPTTEYKLNITYPLDHSFNKVKVEEYLNACDNEVRGIVRKIIDNTMHVSFEKFIINLNKNIKDLVNTILVDRPLFILVDKSYQYKSNYWIYDYLQNYLKFYYPRIKIILLNNHKLDNTLIQDNDYIIKIDDCIYTGSQMSEDVFYINNINNLKLNFFILCSYISKKGQNLITNTFKENKTLKRCKLIFNKTIINFPTMFSCITYSECVLLYKYIKYYMPDGNFENYEDGEKERYITDKYLIYFDHKLADVVSTLTPVYSGYVLNKRNLKIQEKFRQQKLKKLKEQKYNIINSIIIFFNLKKEDNNNNNNNDDNDNYKEKRLLYIPFIKKCERIINQDYYKPECPFTPYKLNFKDMIKKFKLTGKTKHLSLEKDKHKKKLIHSL